MSNHTILNLNFKSKSFLYSAFLMERKKRRLRILLLSTVLFSFIFWSFILISELRLHEKSWDTELAEEHVTTTYNIIQPVRTPLIFLFNSFYGSANWDTNWDSVKNSSDLLKTVKDCRHECHFTSSPDLLPTTDLVLVSLAYYSGYGGKPV